MKRLYTIAVLALALTGCQPPPSTSTTAAPPIVAIEQPRTEPAADPAPPKKPAKPTSYTSKDLRAAVLGLTAREVKELLGAPDEVETAGGGSWRYRNLVIDPETEKPTRGTSILFKHGTVENVLFNPPRKGDPR